MKLLLTALILAAPLAHAGDAGEDIRIMSCTVDFRSAGGFSSIRTEANHWRLPVEKGSVELESMGNVKVVLSKRLVNDEPEYALRITEGGISRGKLTIQNHAFEYAAPLKLHVPDGEDGANYDQIRVVCDTGYAVG